jgi:hypothetical protein
MRHLTEYKYLFIGFLLLASFYARGQCRGPVHAFVPGEILEYDVYYNWGPLWLKAAKVSFAADTIRTGGIKAWKFIATGQSLPSYDWIFKVRDRYESVADFSTLRPLQFYRNTSEGGFRVYNFYQFDYSRQKLFLQTYTSKRPFSRDTLNIKGCLFDLLTAAYYARTLHFDEVAPETRFPLTLVVDETTYALDFVFRGLETIKNKDNKEYNCMVFTAIAMEGSVFKGNEEIRVWITRDQARIPIKVEASILVGSVKAFLRKKTIPAPPG